MLCGLSSLSQDALKSGSLQFPEGKVSSSARNLIQGLLHKNPAERLGARSVNDIKSHSFFHKLNWQEVVEHRIHPIAEQQHHRFFFLGRNHPRRT